MENVDNQEIISRIKYLIDNTSTKFSQAELARRIGMDPSNLSKHLTGKLAISRALINRLVVDLGVSRQWLVNGEGIPFPRSCEANEVRADEIAVQCDASGVAVYDVDVTAGCTPLERLLTKDNITGYINLPHINPESIVVRVTGDSMEPRIIDGGYIAIRQIRSANNIFWGQVYVVVMEDYRMVKVLRRHPKDDSMIVLHSENPKYDDMDVSRSDIHAIFLVESILNFRRLC